MSDTTIPNALKPGDTIGLVSPSARLVNALPDVVSRGKTLLSERGYNVRTFFTKDEGTQSCIQNRLSELRAAFMDPTISTIICIIGGTTFTELLPGLIADHQLQEHIRANPKVVVGYSDNTALHWWLNAMTGLRSFYGPGIIPELGAIDDSKEKASSHVAFCTSSLLQTIAERSPVGALPRSLMYAPRHPAFFRDPKSEQAQELRSSPSWQWVRSGKARGSLFGGCLTVVARLNGIPAIRPDWRDRIIFLETALGDDSQSGLALVRVKAAFADLIAQGVFDHAAGLIVGRPFGYDSDEDRAKYVGAIKGLFCEGIQSLPTFPILFGVDFGHTSPMVTLPYDAMAELDSENDRFDIVEPSVAG